MHDDLHGIDIRVRRAIGVLVLLHDTIGNRHHYNMKSVRLDVMEFMQSLTLLQKLFGEHIWILAISQVKNYPV